MSKIGLEFLVNHGNESEGLNEPGIEFFKDRPFAAVARETGQNSRDARFDAEKPVRITFDVLPIKASEFPSIEEYRAAAAVCLKKADRPSNEKEKGFFQHAVEVLNANEIKVLKIADYNTKGAAGPCEEYRPFHALAMTEGSSIKEDISSGGSFGIGKNAVFALSDIHTAFFSTQYEDEAGTPRFLCMGKTLFISHTDEAGVRRRRKGYWCKLPDYMPLDNPKEIPKWMLREERGTTIFSICMRHNKTDWRHEMAASIIMNFFCAIEQQEMEFEIDKGSIKINRNTLQGLFRDAKILEAVNQLNASASFEIARNLHSCLIDEKTIVNELHVAGLGNVRMRVLLRDGLNYTVGIIRNGMYITNNLSHFNEPFKNFPLYRDFAAIIEPVGKTEGEWFKRLEGPRHDDLSAERISIPAQREQGQRAFERLAKQIRARLKELARTEAKSRVELDELNDFFASDQTRQEDDAAAETDPKALKPTPVTKLPPKKKTIAAAKSEDDDQLPVDGSGDMPISEEPGEIPGFGEGHGDGDGDGSSDKPKPKGRPQARPVELEGERNLLPDRSVPQKRRFFFTAPASGKISLQVEATGLSQPERLSIISASIGVVNGSCVEVICKKGDRVSIDITFDTPYTGPVETSAFVMPVVEAA